MNRMCRFKSKSVVDNSLVILKVALFFYTFLLSANAHAVSTGIKGFSGKEPNNTCTNCHGGLEYQSRLNFFGSTTFEPGSTNNITLALSFTAPPGVTNAHAGINVAISDNGGQLIPGSTTNLSNNELIHPSPQEANSGSFNWNIQWQAPDTAGDYTLYACSQAVNRDFSNGNDEENVACINHTLSVVEPTPPEEPTPSEEPETPDTSNNPLGDVDNDDRADYAFWRPSNQTFYTKSSQTGQIVHREVMGQNGDDEPLLGDIDGNGISDLITWNAISGIWNIVLDDSSSQTFSLGQPGDYPFVVDRDGDGKEDPMVRRPSEGAWYYLSSNQGYAQQRIVYGARATDVPIPGHYDNDGIIDLAIWRDGIWYMRWSSDDVTRTQPLGTQSTDIMVPEDYDGDGITDVAMWRPSNGTWYIYYSTGVYSDGGSRFEHAFGNQSTDIPTPADYDGDGKADLAIRRPTSEEFIYLSSQTGEIIRNTFGRQATDIPVLGAWQIKNIMLNPVEDDISTDVPGRKNLGDIDGDNRSDFIAWTPATQNLNVVAASNSNVLLSEQLGTNNTDVPLVGNLDNDALADFASWNPTSGVWSVRYDDGSTNNFTLGRNGDIPFLIDRDGDGMDDFVVRRPSEGAWYFLASGSNYQQQSFEFGRFDTDLPVPGYYDTDDIVDFAIWRDGTWYMRWSSDNVTRRQDLGTQSTDIMVPADYDGDGITDVAIWRPSTGTWYIYYSSGDYPDGGTRFQRVFGKQSTDIPIPADYDGDGRADLAIYRPTSLEFIYLSSASGQVIRVSQEQNESQGQNEDIPVQAAWKIKQTLLQTEVTSGDNTPDDTPPDDTPSNDEPTAAQQFYNDNISLDIVQNRCIACHVSGGVADGVARFILEPSSTENYQALNQQTFSDFLDDSDVTAEYILSKASGGSGHVGGSQLPVGSEQYNNLSTWLGLVTGTTPGNNGGIDYDYWEGVTMLTPSETLRRASVLMTGKLPSDDAKIALGNGSDAELTSAILALMTGEEFKDFIKRGADDRLLTDKWLVRFFDAIEPGQPYFPYVSKRHYEDESEFKDEFYRWWQGYSYGVARAPLELIAYIVENDLPYTDILTADYTMLNRFSNLAFDGTASFSGNELVNEFKPGRITGAMLIDETVDFEYSEMGLNIINEGPKVDWPHTGILSDLSWLSRYPSTATNRNRARSRWTYFHFLDFDIEKSAARTQDADALADTNNPTLNNPNCTVCHQILDPVAGAYQLFGDQGHFRAEWGGMDSLPYTYKEEPDSPYIEGDTWYRTMLTPGFEGVDAPIGEDSLQWLGQQIVQDQRFASASVKFWWHIVMGTAPISAPTDSRFPGYEIDLATYTEQSRFITESAQSLSTHWNIKRTLVDLMMSPWYRASRAEGSQLHASVGTERLLTPEELDQKTYALTGVHWGRWVEPNPESPYFGVVYSALKNDYNIMYGGIDSDGVSVRSEAVTSVMSQVAITHATEMACPVVVMDFLKPDNERLLFEGISKNIDVFAIASTTQEVNGLWYENRQSYTLEFNGSQGDYFLTLNYDNPYSNHEDQQYVGLVVDHISITDPDGNVLLDTSGFDASVAGTTTGGCGVVEAYNEDDMENQPSDIALYGNCLLRLPVQLDTSAVYTVTIDAYYYDWKPDNIASAPAPQMTISVGSPDAVSQNTVGVRLIKDKIVQLHDRLLGEQVSSNSPSVDIAANLFVNSIIAKSQRSNSREIWEESDVWCNIDWDNIDDPDTEQNEQEIAFQDPLLNLSGWRAVMAHLLSDFKYLHE